MFKFILALVILISPVAWADELWVGPGALSYHTDRSVSHNERNIGLNIEYAWNDQEAVGFGFYKNSNWNITHYAVYRYTPWTLGNIRLGGVVGIADGYKGGIGGVIPAVGAIAVFESKYWGANLLATPYTGGAILALQFKVKIF